MGLGLPRGSQRPSAEKVKHFTVKSTLNRKINQLHGCSVNRPAFNDTVGVIPFFIGVILAFFGLFVAQKPNPPHAS
jgi:hypothetical protein